MIPPLGVQIDGKCETLSMAIVYPFIKNIVAHAKAFCNFLLIVFIGVFVTRFFWGKLFVKILAGDKAVVGGEIIEKALVVGALAIFEAFELDLARLLFFGVVDLFSQVGEAAGAQMI